MQKFVIDNYLLSMVKFNSKTLEKSYLHRTAGQGRSRLRNNPLGKRAGDQSESERTYR